MSKKYRLVKKNMKQDYLTLNYESLGLYKMDHDKWEQRKTNFLDECQLLRSASEWSIGLEDDVKERSIQNAYLEVIRNSKTHIYIENQFFISATGEPGVNNLVENQIAHELFKRIKKAIDKKEKFRVTVVMPLLPGMEGDVDQDTPMPLRLVMHWQYQTICRGGTSLL